MVPFVGTQAQDEHLHEQQAHDGKQDVGRHSWRGIVTAVTGGADVTGIRRCDCISLRRYAEGYR